MTEETRKDSPTTSALALLVIFAVALSLFLWLGRAPLFDVDEGAFSQATLEMFQTEEAKTYGIIDRVISEH